MIGQALLAAVLIAATIPLTYAALIYGGALAMAISGRHGAPYVWIVALGSLVAFLSWR